MNQLRVDRLQPSRLPLLLVASLTLGGCEDIAREINGRLTEPGPGYDDTDRDLRDAWPVFAGAEGFGTDTPAGRGGEIFVVDTLAAEGPGSLRDAVRQPERTVLFAVGGTIVLTDDIHLDFPFFTVAGESAPSPGITVVGAGLVVQTHDIYLSHLAIRPGDFEDGPKPDVRDAISIVRDPGVPEDLDVGNVVVDHCSLTWGVDETASTTYARVHDVTFSSNIIAEGLSMSLHSEGEHSKGLIIGKGSRRVAALGNLFAHNSDRSPLMSADSTTVVAHNVTYNPGKFGAVHYGLTGCCPARATFVDNQVISGPDTPADRGHALHVTTDTHVDTEIFAEGNCGGDLEVAVIELGDAPPVQLQPLTRRSCGDALEAWLDQVGARPADRAPTDARIVNDVRMGTGRIVDTPPEMDDILAQAPTTHSLMVPDAPHEDDDGDGYTRLEEWLAQRRAELTSPVER